MTFRTRLLARVGVTALLAAGALAAAGAPAAARGGQTDLEITMVGTKVATGSPGKIGWAKVTNHGPGVPTALSVTADLSEMDVEHQAVLLPVIIDACQIDEEALKITCNVPEEMIPRVGGTVEIPVFVAKAPTVTTGYTAPVTFSLSSPDDINAANNKKTVELRFGQDSGVDVGVLVPDVTERIVPPPAEEQPSPLRPGDTTILTAMVFNWGDEVAAGLTVTVQLPEHVTFAESLPGCVYDANNRKATCTYQDVVLQPLFSGEGSSDELVLTISWPVMVGADVSSPLTLPDGSVTVEAIQQAQKSPRLFARSLPRNVEFVRFDTIDATEVDASDNVDEFAVLLEGGGLGDGGTGGDEDGDDSGAGGGVGLPVTGVQVGLIGGIGAAVLLAGGALVLLARRRRVVLVAPDDEKPTK